MATTYPIESLKAHPPYLYPGYRSTVRRAPSRPLVIIPHTLSELTGPVYGHESVREHDGDLTRQHAGEPLGERIIVPGRVLDEDGRPVPNTLVEIWQANASGRYIHRRPAPRAARSRILRRRARRHRRRGPIPLHHHQAGRLSLAEPPQRLAPRAHPLLAVRAVVPDAARDPDVFPGRSAPCPRSDVQLIPDENARAAHDVARSTSTSPSPNGRSATVSTSCCAAAARRRWKIRIMTETKGSGPAGLTPSQTAGPVFRVRPDARRPLCDLGPRHERSRHRRCRRRAHHDRGPRRRWRRGARHRRHARGLAGGRRGALSRRRPRPRECRLQGLWPGRVQRRGTLLLPHREARARARPQRRDAGAAPQCRGVRARHLAPAFYPHLLRGRGGKRLRPDPRPRSGRGAPDPHRAPGRKAGRTCFDVRLQGENETVFFEA